MKEYCIGFDMYSPFTRKIVHMSDLCKAEGPEQAKALCYWKHGDDIDIKTVELFLIDILDK